MLASNLLTTANSSISLFLDNVFAFKALTTTFYAIVVIMHCFKQIFHSLSLSWEKYSFLTVLFRHVQM